MPGTKYSAEVKAKAVGLVREHCCWNSLQRPLAQAGITQAATLSSYTVSDYTSASCAGAANPLPTAAR